jgi:trans-aconitate 2-methyltransferase
MAEPRTQAIWDPAVYERYKVYRDRPALDLLLQIPRGIDPHEIWDLGCGTGEHAALLAARHATAVVHGLDSSVEMLAEAHRRRARVDWVQGDIASFQPSTPPDLIFTNAALQWLPDAEQLFPRLVTLLAPGGVFACQIPMSHREPWHEALRAAAHEGPWAAKLAHVQGVQASGAPGDYYRWLAPLCDSIDIWTTTYLHVLEGEDPVVDWMSGTGMRPYVQALTDPAERAAFIADYSRRVAELFPKQPDGATLFPFPRLFIVARRP